VRRMLLVIALLLTACASHASTASTSPTPTESPVASPVALPAVAIGAMVTVRGNKPGESLQVEVLSVRDPASSAVVAPEAGNRFVGIDLTVRNVGTATYRDSPSNGTAIFASNGQRYLADVLDAVQPALGTLSLAPGASATGYITFQVPTAARLARFDFTLDLGFGPQTGTWTIGPGACADPGSRGHGYGRRTEHLTGIWTDGSERHPSARVLDVYSPVTPTPPPVSPTPPPASVRCERTEGSKSHLFVRVLDVYSRGAPGPHDFGKRAEVTCGLISGSKP